MGSQNPKTSPKPSVGTWTSAIRNMGLNHACFYLKGALKHFKEISLYKTGNYTNQAYLLC